jgi:hypothetical protein
VDFKRTHYRNFQELTADGTITAAAKSWSPGNSIIRASPVRYRLRDITARRTLLMRVE